MKKYLKEYEKWLLHNIVDVDILTELEQIKNEDSEIEDRFYKNIEFGTGGLRGIIGAGINRMNIFTVRKATLGLARYILNQGIEAINRGVVIAYDSRKFSKEFAEEAAKVLATNNIKVYIFNELKPTPILSFAVRYFNAYAGIVITASHNPAEYNGYKVYNQYGGQITEDIADKIYTEINKIDNILDYEVINLEGLMNEEKIIVVGEEVDKDYIDNVETLLLNKEIIRKYGEELTIIYTPLHGTGNKPVRNILAKQGFVNVYVVEEQAFPDQEFSTVKAPNPEDISVYNLATKLAKKHNADIIMATDPDADRLGVLVKNGNEYENINGNQLGSLILYYLLDEMNAKKRLPKNGAMVKTIVTSELGKVIADRYNVTTENTLTGFKYIGDKIKEYEEAGDRSFIFGYEESYGYLAGVFVRDKDAVQITAIVAEMALVYKKRNKSLLDILEEIYQEYGYFADDLVSITLKGIEGNMRIKEIVSLFRENPPKEVNGIKVELVEDYLLRRRKNLIDDTIEELKLPKNNAIKLILKDKSWIAIRPSGTEPKIKLYFSTVSDSYEKSKIKIKDIKSSILQYAGL